MATEKVSLTLDEQLLTRARDRVGRRQLSAYVNEALRRQLQRDRLGALLDELAAEVGPIDEEVMEEVRRAWPAPADAVVSQHRNA
ncbi:MAG: hypothetical protein ACRDYX_10820 [Egibacteraceae bacterium]